MKSLAQAVVESAAFLELSDDDIVDPDAAVQAQEAIASSLSDAAEEEKNALLAYCRERAAEIPTSGSPSDMKRRDFYLGFGEAFGITDE
jgi:hypothetical protein